jgi:predicted  nucleic acid-binding Zn-ribbon protein
MSDKAETIELFLLDERGIFVASLYPTVTSAPEFVTFENRHYRRIGKLRDSPEQWQYEHTRTVNASNNCVVFVGDGSPVWRTGDPPRDNGTGVRTTGKYLGTLPSTPDPVTDETLPSQVPTITVTHNGAATPPFPDRYIKPAPGLGATGVPLDQAAALTLARATIAEQAAEIERLKHDIDALKFDTGTLTTERDTLRASVDYLKGERDTLRSALEIAGRRSDSQNASIAYFEQESASHDSALAEVTAERDTLRLEHANFEAQDRYAALEAERDTLKRAIDAAMRTIAAQNAQARAMNEQLDAVTRLICAANGEFHP